MNNENIIEFINSCINDCDMNLEKFAKKGFIELSRLNKKDWSFFVCFMVDRQIKVGGHYPILGSSVNDINDLLNFLYDNGIKLIYQCIPKKDLQEEC